MKKVVLCLVCLFFIFVAYLSFNEIKIYYDNNDLKNNIDEVNKLEEENKILDNEISNMKEKNNNLEIDESKTELLEVWKKELERVKKY